MKPALFLLMGLLIPSVFGWSAPRPRSEKEKGILCLLTPHRYREQGWMLGAEGGLLRDELVQVRSAWKGEALEVEYFGGSPKLWGNTLRLTFQLADPTQPAVEASFSWSSDAGPKSASLDHLSGEVFVIPLDATNDAWARAKQGWNGRTPVQIGFQLHGRGQSEPVCVHGVFDLDPAAPAGK